MLKPANELANAALDAQRLANEVEKDEREQAELKNASKALLDDHHRKFEETALAAARSCALMVSVPGHDLSVERLQVQGFVARRLTRRVGFQHHLERSVAEKRAELFDRSRRLVSVCKGLERLQGDALLHRDPLVSLMETLWRRGGPDSKLDVELLLAHLRMLTAASPDALAENTRGFQEALQVFEELKNFNAKLQSVTWENLTVPAGTDKATLVSWESSEDGSGLVEVFGAQRLKWLATRWPDVAAYLAKVMDRDALAGKFESSFFVATDGEAWWLDVSWPVRASGSEIRFCKPAVAMPELIRAGYRVELSELDPAEAAALTRTEDKEEAEDGYYSDYSDESDDDEDQSFNLAFTLRVRWK